MYCWIIWNISKETAQGMLIIYALEALALFEQQNVHLPIKSCDVKLLDWWVSEWTHSSKPLLVWLCGWKAGKKERIIYSFLKSFFFFYLTHSWQFEVTGLLLLFENFKFQNKFHMQISMQLIKIWLGLSSSLHWGWYSYGEGKSYKILPCTE